MAPIAFSTTRSSSERRSEARSIHAANSAIASSRPAELSCTSRSSAPARKISIVGCIGMLLFSSASADRARRSEGDPYERLRLIFKWSGHYDAGFVFDVPLAFVGLEWLHDA